MKAFLDADAVAARLPQQYPFLMIDRVVSYTPGSRICCLKNVSSNEEYFQGHFPGRKIMPGVLIGEALAQACALLGILDAEGASAEAARGAGDKPAPGFLAAANLKFLTPVVPGDQLLLQASLARTMEGLRAFEVEASIDGQVACKGLISTTARSVPA